MCNDEEALREQAIEEANLRWGMRVSDLRLSRRVANILKKAGIRTVSMLTKKTKNDLREIIGFKRQYLRQIVKALRIYSLVLKRY